MGNSGSMDSIYGSDVFDKLGSSNHENTTNKFKGIIKRSVCWT
jgi:hypothetical protein